MLEVVVLFGSGVDMMGGEEVDFAGDRASCVGISSERNVGFMGMLWIDVFLSWKGGGGEVGAAGRGGYGSSPYGCI